MKKRQQTFPIQNFMQWYFKYQRFLPWRINQGNKNFYPVWVSEVMLQQTQVKTVIGYFERFMQRFPSFEELSIAEDQSIISYFAGLGYYARALNFVKAVRLIAKKGHFPETLEEWLQIPGVGPYTASAIVSLGDNQPVAVLDTNVIRILARWYLIAEPKKVQKDLWKYSQDIMNLGLKYGFQPKDINQALMEFGALVCLPRPDCTSCCLKSFCKAFKNEKTLEIPKRITKKPMKILHEKKAAFFSQKNEVYLAPSQHWRKGLWDFVDLEQASSESIIGMQESSYVITSHKIFRKTFIYRVQKKTFHHLSNGQWFTLDALPPIGGPLKKDFQKIQEHLKKV